MPMSPRLLRPRASGSAIVASDADARAYVLAVNAADGQPLEPAVQLAINDFITGCKSDGIWDAIKASCILMGARTLSGALTPLVGSAPTNNGPFVSGDYNRETGLLGNGTTKYLASNRNNNADPQNSRHISVYVSVADTRAGFTAGYIGGGGFNPGSSTVQISNISTNLAFRSSTAAAGNVAGAANATGFAGCSRSSSASYIGRVLGANTTFNEASQTPANETVDVFDRGSSSRIPANARLAFYSIGESLDLALLDSRVTTLYNAIGAAIP